MTLEAKAAKLGAQGIAIIVLMVTILVILGIAAWKIKDYQALLKKNEAAESVSTVTSQATDALTETAAATQQVEVIVRQERVQRDSAFQELKQRDQTVNDWANQPLPESLRKIDEQEH